MRLSENFGNSFDYARKLLSDGSRIILLIVLDLIPIVNWILLGYGGRVLREAPSSEYPPKLENYASMFIDGAKIFFGTLIYMAVPIVLIVLGAHSLVESSAMGEGVASSLLTGGAGVLALLVGLVLCFILLVLLGVGIAHMVKSGKFSKFFAFGEILRIINGIGKVKYFGWVILTGLIALLISGLAASVPYIGWLLSAMISPFLTVFIFRSLGDLYNDGAPSELKITVTPALMSAGVKCSTCGTPLQSQHKFCPACGAPAPVPSIMETKFCIACGTRIPTGAGFCGVCGAKQD
jgi:hypothetical protein